jgi:hypothetical protein
LILEVGSLDPHSLVVACPKIVINLTLHSLLVLIRVLICQVINDILTSRSSYWRSVLEINCV